MAGYMAAQALVKTLLSGVSGLQVTEGDYSVLDRGYDKSAVLIPGSFGRHELAEMTREYPWAIVADLFVRFSENDAAYSTIGTLMDSVINKVQGARSLSQDYVIDGIETESDVEGVYNQSGNGPFFITLRLRFTVTEFI